MAKYGFYILSGPWGRLWCRFGYDPRKTSDGKRYQTGLLFISLYFNIFRFKSWFHSESTIKFRSGNVFVSIKMNVIHKQHLLTITSTSQVKFKFYINLVILIFRSIACSSPNLVLYL